MQISFVIPAHNEAVTLKNLINSIKANVELDFECIVVDNGSTDATQSVALEAGAQVIHLQEKVFPSVARNIGSRHAKGEILVFLDGDTRLTVEWGETLKREVSELIKNPMILTGARVVTPEREKCSWIETYWFAPMAEDPVSYINGANIITTKTAYSFLGGMNESMATGEDYEISVRAKKNGVNVIINPGYRLIHDGYPKDIKNFYRRERWHGKGDAQNFRTIINSKVALISLFFLACLITSTIALFIYGLDAAPFALVPIAIPIACAVLRFKNHSLRTIIASSLLYAIYLFARGITTATHPFE